VPLVAASRDYLDYSWPSVTGAGVPQYFAYISQDPGETQVILGPWPDNTYRAEVVGKKQPAALSSGNPTTYLVERLPDLFVAASMVFLSGYMRNYGAQADDPRMGGSWETQYQILKASADTWEARKRWAGASWTSKALEPTAQPQRG